MILNNLFKVNRFKVKQVQGKPILAFIPSNEFKGERKGYKFTKGPKGLGYYLDN